MLLTATAREPAAKKEVILESRSMPRESKFSGGLWLGTTPFPDWTNASGSSKSDPVEEVGDGASRFGERTLALGKLGIISSSLRLTPLTRFPNCL